MSKRKTTQEFIEEANKVHSDRYSYTNTKYKNAHSPVTITCSIHGDFQQTASDHIRGRGCWACSQRKPFNTKSIIKEFRKIHKNKYDYSKVNFVSLYEEVEIICETHGSFFMTPYTHRHHKADCQYCYYGRPKRKRTSEDFIKDAKLRHDNEYDYTKVCYVNTTTPVEIICKKHGSFFPTPANHLRGTKCPSCSKLGFSHKAINWMDDIMKKEDIYIQHMKNSGGEFRLPGTKKFVDGYCQSTNTVYEFYGDVWHGNPTRFSKNEKCHPITSVTADKLYKDTIKRECLIKQKGFNLVTIWESDYDKISSR